MTITYTQAEDDGNVCMEMRVTCDVCGELIESATSGSFSWTSHKPEDGFVFSHNECFTRVQRANGLYDQALPLTQFKLHYDYGVRYETED